MKIETSSVSKSISCYILFYFILSYRVLTLLSAPLYLSLVVSVHHPVVQLWMPWNVNLHWYKSFFLAFVVVVVLKIWILSRTVVTQIDRFESSLSVRARSASEIFMKLENKIQTQRFFFINKKQTTTKYSKNKVIHMKSDLGF